MCDEFDSGLDSFDTGGDSFDDVSMDDLSGAMDETPDVMEPMDTMDDLGDMSESFEEPSVGDLMDDTDMDMSDEVFEEEAVPDVTDDFVDDTAVDVTDTLSEDVGEEFDDVTDIGEESEAEILEVTETDVLDETADSFESSDVEEIESAEFSQDDVEGTDSALEFTTDAGLDDGFAESIDETEEVLPDETESMEEVAEEAGESEEELEEAPETVTEEAETAPNVDELSDTVTEVNPEESEITDVPQEAVPTDEVTENSALDNMAEYMAGHNYGPDDFETYSQDPEWQQLNNNLLQEMGREPIDYSESAETTEATAMDSMTEYMYEHNYGRDDFETYSQDPEWQQLNNDLLQEMGREPIEYGESTETTEASAMDSMTEYMYEHNYGRDDFETYSQDPEWQQLNNDLLQEMGREPIDYSETGETVETPETVIPEGEQTVADLMDSVETGDDELQEDDLETGDVGDKPDSSVEAWMDDAEATSMPEGLETEDGLEVAPTVEETAEAIPFDIDHNTEFTNSLLEDRPDLTEMFENGEFYEQGNNEYGFEGTCGETTQANTLNHLLGTNEITENDVLSVAIDKNLCEVNMLDPSNSGGTSTEQFMQLYDEMNHRTGDTLNVECFDYEEALSIDDMASRLESGSVLNIAVDSNELWNLPSDITDTSHYTDHWISVTGVDRGPDGNISGFKIVDSGGGESYLDLNKFERCYYGAKNNPVIDPTCIVVSRKGK